MAVSGITGMAEISPWAIDVLFEQPNKDGSQSAPPPASVPTVAVSSSAKSALSGATAQAVASLTAGGLSTEGTAPSDENPNGRLMTVAEDNALVASNNAMTSDQISAALYSGSGMKQVGYTKAPDVSVIDIVNSMKLTGEEVIRAAELPDATAWGADPAEYKAFGQQYLKLASSLQQAFANHSVHIQKMSDIESLKFSFIEKFGGNDDNAGATYSIGSMTYDQDSMKQLTSSYVDGKQGMSLTVGEVQLQFTWQDNST